MDDGHVPDQLERRIRFGCGFVVGAVLGFVWAVWNLPELSEDLRVPLVVGAGTALLSGVVATRYGDRCWYWLRWFF